MKNRMKNRMKNFLMVFLPLMIIVSLVFSSSTVNATVVDMTGTTNNFGLGQGCDLRWNPFGPECLKSEFILDWKKIINNKVAQQDASAKGNWYKKTKDVTYDELKTELSASLDLKINDSAITDKLIDFFALIGNSVIDKVNQKMKSSTDQFCGDVKNSDTKKCTKYAWKNFDQNGEMSEKAIDEMIEEFDNENGNNGPCNEAILEKDKSTDDVYNAFKKNNDGTKGERIGKAETVYDTHKGTYFYRMDEFGKIDKDADENIKIYDTCLPLNDLDDWADSLTNEVKEETEKNVEARHNVSDLMEQIDGLVKSSILLFKETKDEIQNFPKKSDFECGKYMCPEEEKYLMYNEIEKLEYYYNGTLNVDALHKENTKIQSISEAKKLKKEDYPVVSRFSDDLKPFVTEIQKIIDKLKSDDYDMLKKFEVDETNSKTDAHKYNVALKKELDEKVFIIHPELGKLNIIKMNFELIFGDLQSELNDSFERNRKEYNPTWADNSKFAKVISDGYKTLSEKILTKSQIKASLTYSMIKKIVNSTEFQSILDYVQIGWQKLDKTEIAKDHQLYLTPEAKKDINGTIAPIELFDKYGTSVIANLRYGGMFSLNFEKKSEISSENGGWNAILGGNIAEIVNNANFLNKKFAWKSADPHMAETGDSFKVIVGGNNQSYSSILLNSIANIDEANKLWHSTPNTNNKETLKFIGDNKYKYSIDNVIPIWDFCTQEKRRNELIKAYNTEIAEKNKVVKAFDDN
jgi:hypothetical protein